MPSHQRLTGQLHVHLFFLAAEGILEDLCGADDQVIALHHVWEEKLLGAVPTDGCNMEAILQGAELVFEVLFY